MGLEILFAETNDCSLADSGHTVTFFALAHKGSDNVMKDTKSNQYNIFGLIFTFSIRIKFAEKLPASRFLISWRRIYAENIQFSSLSIMFCVEKVSREYSNQFFASIGQVFIFLFLKY